MKARYTIGASLAILALGLGAGGHAWLNTNRFGKVIWTGCCVGIVPSPEYVRVARDGSLGWTPSATDVSRAEERLQAYVADHRAEVGPKVADGLSQYRRVYYGRSAQGVKHLFVSGTHREVSPYREWRRYPLSSLIGGGDLAWGAVYDSDLDDIVDFHINTPR